MVDVHNAEIKLLASSFPSSTEMIMVNDVDFGMYQIVMLGFEGEDDLKICLIHRIERL